MTNTLTVDSVNVTVDKKKKETKKTATVLAKLLVTPAECERIQQIGRKFASLTAGPPTSMSQT
jgi:hypothetical protein